MEKKTIYAVVGSAVAGLVLGYVIGNPSQEQVDMQSLNERMQRIESRLVGFDSKVNDHNLIVRANLDNILARREFHISDASLSNIGSYLSSSCLLQGTTAYQHITLNFNCR